MTIAIILLIAALILAILAAINIPSSRVSLGWASFACFIGYILLAKDIVV